MKILSQLRYFFHSIWNTVSHLVTDCGNEYVNINIICRLMKTDKVQGIIASMQDITNIALQLQSENRHIPNPSEDQQLLERLHLQRHREGRNFHEIFFKHTPQQRMAIISYDREIQVQRRFRDSLLKLVACI